MLKEHGMFLLHVKKQENILFISQQIWYFPGQNSCRKDIQRKMQQVLWDGMRQQKKKQKKLSNNHKIPGQCFALHTPTEQILRKKSMCVFLNGYLVKDEK